MWYMAASTILERTEEKLQICQKRDETRSATMADWIDLMHMWCFSIRHYKVVFVRSATVAPL